MKTLTRSFCILAATVICAALFGSVAIAKPGPVMAGMVERYEYHSNTALTASPVYDDDSYLYSIIFLSRKLDKGFTGMVTYINKYGISDGQALTHIGNLSFSQDYTPHWKGTYSYSLVANAPAKNRVNSTFAGTGCSLVVAGVYDCTSSLNDADYFNVGVEFNSDASGKAATSWKANLGYNTGSDFSSGRSIAPKVTVKHVFTKNLTGSAGYQFVWGLNETRISPTKKVGNEISNHQLDVNFDYKLSKKDRIQFAYLFFKNEYFGNQGDDNVVRLSYVRMLKTK